MPAWIGPSPEVTTPIMVQHAMNLIQSYKNLLGKDLIVKNSLNDKEIASELFKADRYLSPTLVHFCSMYETYYNDRLVE